MASQKVKLKVFGIARDILGGREVTIETPATRAGELREFLMNQYPKLKGLNSLLIAVNQQYAKDDVSISEKDEIAIIPPVSGG